MITPRPLEEGYKPVYAVKDEMTGFGSPLVYENQQVAIRDFVACAKEVGTTINKWLDDYALYYIGQFCPEYGTILGEIEPILVLRAKSVVNGGNFDETDE